MKGFNRISRRSSHKDLYKIMLRPLSISLGFAQNIPPSTCTKSCTNLLKDLTRISLGSHKKFEKPLTKIFMPGPRQQVLISSDPTKTILSDIYSCILSGIYSDLFSCNTFWQRRGGEDWFHRSERTDFIRVVLSSSSSWHSIRQIFWHSFWRSIWYIFGDSLWLRSGWEHSDPELAASRKKIVTYSYIVLKFWTVLSLKFYLWKRRKEGANRNANPVGAWKETCYFVEA